jgi:hypothetical protein
MVSILLMLLIFKLKLSTGSGRVGNFGVLKAYTWHGRTSRVSRCIIIVVTQKEIDFKSRKFKIYGQ